MGLAEKTVLIIRQIGKSASPYGNEQAHHHLQSSIAELLDYPQKAAQPTKPNLDFLNRRYPPICWRPGRTKTPRKPTCGVKSHLRRPSSDHQAHFDSFSITKNYVNARAFWTQISAR